MGRVVSGECKECESYFDLSFEENLVSQEPEYCPFCGEAIEEPMEDYIEDDDDFDDETQWE
jgi:hypothetical protein